MIVPASSTVHFWMHVLIDGSIGLSYISISATLGYFIYRARRSLPYHHVVLAFGAFILSCGMGHFSHIWTLLYPESPLEGYIGAVTALASVLTAVCLPPLVPKMLRLLKAASLAEQRHEMIRQRDEFLGILSHELKTPLTALHGYISILKRRIASHPHTHPGIVDAATASAAQTARLYRMIMELLELSRLQLGQFVVQKSPINLVDVVCRLVHQHRLTIELPHQIVLHSSCQSLPIFADEQALEHVLNNLLTNAVKYSPYGGMVEVTVGQNDHYATIAVADQGIGVPETEQAQLFERFYRASNATGLHISGFGIGLYLVRELIERHGGEVQYKPRPDGGSIFSVTLPICSQASLTEAEAVSYSSLGNEVGA